MKWNDETFVSRGQGARVHMSGPKQSPVHFSTSPDAQLHRARSPSF